MRAILTGMNGTVAPVVARHFEALGHEVLRWDRTELPPINRAGIERFINESQPDAIFHVATGPAEWAAEIARVCAAASVRLLFTSSVSVFGPEQQGPFGLETLPGASDEYGRYKRDCEEKIARANPGAVIARMGWQIGDAAGSNNMVDYLERTMAQAGRIEASANWFPACSFLQDTADALCRLVEEEFAGGVYHLDGNPGLSFREIVQALNQRHGKRWHVAPVDEPRWNSRMIDNRIGVAPITRRLPERKCHGAANF